MLTVTAVFLKRVSSAFISSHTLGESKLEGKQVIHSSSVAVSIHLTVALRDLEFGCIKKNKKAGGGILCNKGMGRGGCFCK